MSIWVNDSSTSSIDGWNNSLHPLVNVCHSSNIVTSSWTVPDIGSYLYPFADSIIKQQYFYPLFSSGKVPITRFNLEARFASFTPFPVIQDGNDLFSLRFGWSEMIQRVDKILPLFSLVGLLVIINLVFKSLFSQSRAATMDQGDPTSEEHPSESGEGDEQRSVGSGEEVDTPLSQSFYTSQCRLGPSRYEQPQPEAKQRFETQDGVALESTPLVTSEGSGSDDFFNLRRCLVPYPPSSSLASISVSESGSPANVSANGTPGPEGREPGDHTHPTHSEVKVIRREVAGYRRLAEEFSGTSLGSHDSRSPGIGPHADIIRTDYEHHEEGSHDFTANQKHKSSPSDKGSLKTTTPQWEMKVKYDEKAQANESEAQDLLKSRPDLVLGQYVHPRYSLWDHKYLRAFESALKGGPAIKLDKMTVVEDIAAGILGRVGSTGGVPMDQWQGVQWV